MWRLYGYAEPLYRRATAERLADLVTKRGRSKNPRARYRPDDWRTAKELVGLFIGRGRVEEAIAVLRPVVDAGDHRAAERLAHLLAKHSRVEEAIAVLRPVVDAGDSSAAERVLAELLAKHGHEEELRARADADAGDWWAARRLADLLQA